MIWDWAKVNGYFLITTGIDSVSMSQQLGWPPKVIHIEKCDYRFRVIEEKLRTMPFGFLNWTKTRQ